MNNDEENNEIFDKNESKSMSLSINRYYSMNSNESNKINEKSF